MRKIAASYIFPIVSAPLKQGILIISESGKIIDIIDTQGNLTELLKLEYYNGIIVPRFIDNNGIEEGIADLMDNVKTQLTFSEIKKLTNIALHEILEDYTLKPATKYNLKSNFGSFEIGKNPGVALITNINFETFSLTEKSEIRILL